MWVNVVVNVSHTIHVTPPALTFLSIYPTPNSYYFIKSLNSVNFVFNHDNWTYQSDRKMCKIQCAFVLCTLFVIYVAADTKYTNKYDNIDVDKILTNERVLSNYIKCLMDEGPCTPEGRELKSEFLGVVLVRNLKNFRFVVKKYQNKFFFGTIIFLDFSPKFPK